MRLSDELVALQRRREEIEVPGLDKSIWVRELSVGEMLDYRKLVMSDDIDDADAGMMLGVMATVDEDGVLIFDDLEAMKGIPMNLAITIVTMAGRLNNASEAALKAAETEMATNPLVNSRTNSRTSSTRRRKKS